jgi:GT2 family glycosyltransferase
MSFCDVAVIILAHNGQEYTNIALESILSATTKPWEIFLVDNASEDGTPELFSHYLPLFHQAGIRAVSWRNKENLGCSLARNEAWQKATAKYTVFMDNDAAVCTRDWLSRFIACFEEHPKLRILGPKLLYPYLPHLIQCAGVVISPQGRIAFRGRGAQRHDVRYEVFWQAWALISACWMMRTDLRDTVGMLDECFHPVQYEDLDLCLRTRLAGWEVAYTPLVEMYHFEGTTTAAGGKEAYKHNIARNSLKFRERYHELFKSFTDELPPEEYRWLSHAEMGLGEEVDMTMC